MMQKDNLERADAEAAPFEDLPVVHVWDPRRQVGNLYSKTLGLQSTAWDFYFLYPPGVTWDEDDPPEPAFWMHQLPAATGADGKLLLNPGRFSHELIKLLGRGDAHMAWDRAFMLHAKGLGALKRGRAQSSLEDVLEAVYPTKDGIRLDEK